MTDSPDPIGVDLLDESLLRVETQLLDLGRALRDGDTHGLDLSAARLHAALARAIDLFSTAASGGRVPDALRLRLVRASGEVAAYREALARATASLDRAIDVLLPRDRSGLAYGASGRPARASLGTLAV